VPTSVSAFWWQVAFDDPATLQVAVREVRPAAVVLEPVVDRAPSRAWLEMARAAADAAGAVLVFDEVKTGFRLARGGAAERWGVRPDLAVLGKAMANGYPLAAVVGRADLMARVRETWVSSTLATEWVALAAADAVLDVWEKQDVAGHIRSVGEALLSALTACPSDRLTVSGLPEMWALRFAEAEDERRVLAACRRRGVLFKRGPYNFPSLAHGEAEVAVAAAALRASLDEVEGVA
jgi:glutamate-1-semialdehyde aminotransferase